MNSYKSSAELKAAAKEQLFGNYGTTVGAFVIVSLITLAMTSLPFFMIPTTSIFNSVIYYLVAFIISLFSGIFVSGQAFLYLKIFCRQPVSVGDIFYGFHVHPNKAIVIQLVLSLISYACTIPALIFEFIFLNTGNVMWMLVMSVTWIVGTAIMIWLSLLFSQAFYLLQDFPEYSAKDLLKLSRRIMKGHKGRLFYIEISFLPLCLLGFLSCCIAFLWIIPYINATMANFYMDLVNNQSGKQEEK